MGESIVKKKFIDYIDKIIDNGRISHAYLFEVDNYEEDLTYIYSFIKMLYQKKQNVVLYRQSKCSNIIFITTVILMISLMMLCSNQFKFGVIVIATDSMKEEISSGDVVIYERIDSDDVLEINQIIVFEKDNSLIIHRIVNMEFIDGELRYYTKGDNNEENDSGYITRNNIIGYTDFKISYVGYPTLWLHEIFK